MAIATGEAVVVEPRSSKGPHSRKDGNPVGWLARRRMANGRGFERSQADILVSEYPFPQGRGWF
jgi:hypothetical protein